MHVCVDLILLAKELLVYLFIDHLFDPQNKGRGKVVRTPTRRPTVNAQKVAIAEKVFMYMYMPAMRVLYWQKLRFVIILIYMQRERDALDKVDELERKMTEMTEQMNALIIKERTTNDELQGVRTELMKVSYLISSFCFKSTILIVWQWHG